MTEIERDFQDTSKFLQMIMDRNAPDRDESQYKVSEQGCVLPCCLELS